MKQLEALYQQWAGTAPLKAERLPGEGSNRVYVRFTGTDGRTVIGVIGLSREENHAFLYLTRHFTGHKLPVPQILLASDDQMRYLQTDLGNRSLYQALADGRAAGGRYNNKEKELLRRTLTLLPELQVRGARELDFTQCYPQPELDRTGVLFDLNSFKYCFLKATGIHFHELKLEADFRLLAKDLTAETAEAFLYRDFQSRNVMLSPTDEPFFIDYQGGRRGAVQYDVASFLWQASSLFTPALREELTGVYLQSLRRYTEVNEPAFRRQLRLFVLFRLLQVLGAYGFRGYFEQKTYFVRSIPPAIANLREWLAGDGHPYPYLGNLLMQLTQLPAFAPAPSVPATDVHEAGADRLVVRIFSFSYHKGIPRDESGNGGGYVFDCRSTHNPGRYEPYQQLTGLDEPVIRFLEDDGQINTFLESVYRLADAHVSRYMQRGFTDLLFSFGCTGGQHRSVYAAQRLAERLNQQFGVEVRLVHREQNREQHFHRRIQTTP